MRALCWLKGALFLLVGSIVQGNEESHLEPRAALAACASIAQQISSASQVYYAGLAAQKSIFRWQLALTVDDQCQ